jgi:hypothetical protein
MKPLLAAAAGILALVILASALLSLGSPSAVGLSPQLADAPPALVPLAFQAGAMTGIDANVLLAVAKVETDSGRARQGQPDELVPADIRPGAGPAALQAGGATAQLLGLHDYRRIGDWVNPQAVGAEHAMGFVQLLPFSWRAEAAAAAGASDDRQADADIVLQCAADRPDGHVERARRRRVLLDLNVHLAVVQRPAARRVGD